jgi:hypothetical protein
MGTARMMGVPKTPAKISDKNVVGSTVAAATWNVDDDGDNDDTTTVGSVVVAEMMMLCEKASPGVNSRVGVDVVLRRGVAVLNNAVVGETTKHSTTMEPMRRTEEHAAKESKRKARSVVMMTAE